MDDFGVTNATKGVTQGPYPTIEEARAQVNRMVEPGDEWEIVHMADRVGSAAVVETGRGPIPE